MSNPATAEVGLWQDVAQSGANGHTEIDRVREFFPVTSGRIRLTVHRTRIDISRIWEVELRGSAEDNH